MKIEAPFLCSIAPSDALIAPNPAQPLCPVEAAWNDDCQPPKSYLPVDVRRQCWLLEGQICYKKGRRGS